MESETGDVVTRQAVDGAEFWVADESPEHANSRPVSLGGGAERMILYVDYRNALFDWVADATVVEPVANPYGWRLGRIVDPFGHHWEIGKPLTHAA